ncbi:SRPBCC family protein [Brachybacterium phenoliresistens]|uniref:Polyketide cyclase n=1 Tax=Brachybacterium phenoliresistens TaxID=396014 RepID=Z9JMG5_9MICO|nr:SRPBCC family protein [Brachybacterium phenoliresistens]EWS79595.1 polyketide cyclase [Brachybacterium phenoliresistens]
MSESAPTENRVVTASGEVAAPAAEIFELIADPAQQPRWDGNDNLGSAEEGQRVRAVGDSFFVTLTKGTLRENHVVEFEEGRLIAWKPAPDGWEPGHLWRWRLTDLGNGRTRVEHTYDWTQLEDPARLERARGTTEANLLASIERLTALAESS